MNIFHDQKLITAKIHGKWIGMGYLKEKSLLDFVKKKKTGRRNLSLKNYFQNHLNHFSFAWPDNQKKEIEILLELACLRMIRCPMCLSLFRKCPRSFILRSLRGWLRTRTIYWYVNSEVIRDVLHYSQRIGPLKHKSCDSIICFICFIFTTVDTIRHIKLMVIIARGGLWEQVQYMPATSLET